MTSIESPAETEQIDTTSVFARYQKLLSDGLRQALADARAAVLPATATAELLEDFYGQVEYPLGWRHPDLTPARAHPGKLIRPTLVLLAAELAAGRNGADERQRQRTAHQAVPAGVSVELTHNFSLVHDDIEDGDEERRHRPTLWKLWGVPQAINTGDGIFAIARHALWRLAKNGVAADTIVALAELLDRTCVELCEGQYLDMRYEGRRDVTVPMYLDMIGRKTAALMACATEMGARIGAPRDAAQAQRLATFGRALGLAFQLRDDLLGVWAPTAELGKTPAGDVRRKKMSLPILHAITTASADDQRTLSAIYSADGEATNNQIAQALAIFERTGARERIRAALAEQSRVAQDALDSAADDAPEAREAHALLSALVAFVSTAV